MKKITALLACFLSSLVLLAQPTELTPDKNATPSNPAYTTLAASNGVVYGNDGNPFVLETRKFQAYSELRTFSMPTVGVFYQVWLSDRLEFWKADFNDNSTPDNNATTLIGVSNIRYKRFFSSLTNPLTTEFKGTWNASTNQPALTTTPTANGSYYLVSQAGTQSITGLPENYEAGDQVISNGTGWFRIRSSLVDGSVSEGKIAAGAVSTPKVADKAITPSKTTFFEKGKNLFDAAAVRTANAQINQSTGAVVTSPSWTTQVTGLIEVEGGATYIHNQIGNRPVAQYTSDGTYLTGSYTNTFNSSTPLTTQSGARYIRLQLVGTETATTFQLEKGSTPTTVEPYRQQIVEQVLTKAILKSELSLSDLATKSALGGNLSLIAKYIPGKNLVDFSSLTPKSQINTTTGAIINNASYTTSVTDFMPVRGSSAYVHNMTGNRVVAEYDSLQVFLKATAAFNATTPLITQSNTRYLRMQLLGTETATTFQLEQSSTPTTPIEPYSLRIRPAYLPDAILKSDFDYKQALTVSQIDPLKVVSLVPGKNLFDPASVTAKAQINTTTGAIINNASYTTSVTDFMPVRGSTVYVHNMTGNRTVAEYDSLRRFVKATTAFNSAAPLTTQSNTRFLRLQLLGTETSFQVEKGSVPTTPVEPYALRVPGSYLVDAITKNELPISSVVTKAELGDPAQIAKKVTGKNLFDPSQIQANRGVNATTGAPYTRTGYGIVTGISVQPNTSYVSNTIQYCAMHEYTSAGVWIRSQVNLSSTAPKTTSPTTAFVTIEVYTASTSAYYATLQIEKGTYSTFFEPYRKEVADALSPSRVQEALSGFTNYVSLPAYEYMLKGIENSIYFRPVLRRWMPGHFYVRFSGNLRNQRSRAKVVPTTTTAFQATATLYDADFRPVSAATTTVRVSDPAAGASATNVLVIGDSWTAPGASLKRAGDLLTGVNFLGIRQGAAQFGAKFSEGIPGWTLSDHMSVTRNAFNGFSSFVQPADPYRYYGTTAAMLAALADNTNPLYATATRIGFSSSTGKKTSPATNDVMWVTASNRFERFDGTAWVVITEAELSFSFNFAKYRSVWGIAQPQIVCLQLGINDIAKTDWWNTASVTQQFKTNLDALITNVKADNPAVRFVVMIPCSAFGDIDNDQNEFTPARNAAMFTHREMLIASYDNREAENIYLLDAGSAVDDEYGWHKEQQLPFPEYAIVAGYNDQKRPVVTDPIHPDNGYYQIGTRLAAIIQYVRGL